MTKTASTDHIFWLAKSQLAVDDNVDQFNIFSVFNIVSIPDKTFGKKGLSD